MNLVLYRRVESVVHMVDGLNPTEEYDGSISVRVLKDKEGQERIQCQSFREAIQTVKEIGDLGRL